MPIGIDLFANDYERWAYAIEDGMEHTPEAQEFTRIVKDATWDAPPGFQFNTVKYAFAWEGVQKLKRVKPGPDGIQCLISIEQFLEHENIKAFVENAAKVDQIMYYDKKGGTSIDEAKAIEAYKNIDPQKKPASNRPGKRARTEETKPAPPASESEPAASNEQDSKEAATPQTKPAGRRRA